jgi:hypothetical protein
MDRLSPAGAANPGRAKEIQPVNLITDSTASQRLRVLAWLIQQPLTTLQARNQLFIMSIAARIFELKARGHNIITTMIPVKHGSKRMIAQYTLLSGGSHD